MRTTILKLFLMPVMLISSIETEAQENNLNQNNMGKTNCEYQCGNQYTGMCEKLPMEADGIVRLSKIEVYPEYLDEYIKYAVEVGEFSLLTESGVLTMYAVSEKDNPCKVTILETYASKAAYEQHIASEHFQKYK